MDRYADRFKKRQTFFGKNIKAFYRKLEKTRHVSEQELLVTEANIAILVWLEEYLKAYFKIKDKGEFI